MKKERIQYYLETLERALQTVTSGLSGEELEAGNDTPGSGKPVNLCYPESDRNNLRLKAAQNQNEEKS